ncbi:MAG TPA: hypothetical protein VHC86_05485 [Opitutaceae bacterium]|nr:hypothetical protein [Opitutaceae bacterium]
MSDAPTLDPHVFLAGRPPMSEFISFARRSAAGAGAEDSRAESRLADDWRAANDRLRRLEETEKGVADNAAASPLGPELQAQGERLLRHRAFRNAHGAVPTEIAMVELDRLVVFQKHVNLARAELIKRELGYRPDPETVGRVAFGIERHTPPVRLMQTHDVFTFVCDSKDFRMLEPIHLPAGELAGLDCRGLAARGLVLPVGFSLNCLSAIRAEGRLILFNGSHRAYAMRELGLTHAPCVILKTTRPEEIELVASKEITQRADLYLRNPRPPLLKDYFDPELRRIVPVPRSHRMVRIQLRVDQSDVPGI